MNLDAIRRCRLFLVAALFGLSLLGGCASTANNPRDPFEPINRGIYQFNDGLDHLVLRPAAEIYRGVLPQFVRTGVGNFFSNINDILVALNNLLQGKFTNALSDVGRVAVNTTAGLLGVLDVATEIGLEKNDEDFGQTLGYWGIGDGPFLMLPLVGPSNLRDAVGKVADFFVIDPIIYVSPSRARNQLWGTRLVNRRAELLDTSRILETAALDPYEFLRDAYIQRRRNLVHDGNPPRDKDDDMEIPMKPRTQLEESEGAVIISGNADDRSPAEIESVEAAKSSAPAPSGPGAGQPAAPPAAAGTPVVRLWLPPTR